MACGIRRSIPVFAPCVAAIAMEVGGLDTYFVVCIMTTSASSNPRRLRARRHTVALRVFAQPARLP